MASGGRGDTPFSSYDEAFGSYDEAFGSYDEVFDHGGKLRQPYAGLEHRFGFDVLRPPVAIAERLCDRPLGDDVRILPIPWVLGGREYASVVRAATAQRARALQMFFADVVLGGGRFFETLTSFAQDRLHAVLESERTSLTRLRSQWDGHGREEVRFVYGPDLVRGPGGSWLVLEDNVGCVGGSADSFFVWTLYAEAATRATRAIGGRGMLSPGEPDLRVAVVRWLDGLGRNVGDNAVVAMLGCEPAGDELRSVLIHENERRRHILETLGIEVVDSCHTERLLSAQGGGADRVRAIVNVHAEDPAIDEAFRRGMALFNAPGTGILGNKALLPHVEEMIRFYCREEPIASAPSTYVLDDGVLPPDPDEWVVKSASGCQGTEVFVLRSQPRERLEAIRKLVRDSWPTSVFVAQRRVDPSHLPAGGPDGWERYLVELRPVAYVTGWSDVHVGGQPVGKAISSLDVRRRHNLSQGACYVPVTCV